MLPAPPASLLSIVTQSAGLANLGPARPMSGGRSNQVWQLGAGTDTFVLKLYRQAPDNPVFPNDPEAERKCLLYLKDTLLAPKLVAAGSSETGDWLLYRFEAGKPWDDDVSAVASRLKDLHATTPPKGLRHAPNGSAALSAQGVDCLKDCTGQICYDLQKMRPKIDVQPSNNMVFLHGDPVSGNILHTPAGLTFIDWQCPAQGDACNDIAIFLSPSMQTLYRGAPLSEDKVATFLESYAGQNVVERYRALRPWYHWHMAAYCLWRWQQGASDYADGFWLERSALDAFS